MTEQLRFVGNITHGKRTITAQQVLDIIVWLRSVRTSAMGIGATVANVNLSKNSNSQIVLGRIEIEIEKATEITVADITNLNTWIQNNVYATIPDGCAITDDLSWSVVV